MPTNENTMPGMPMGDSGDPKTTDGGLSPADQAMLKSMLQPNPASMAPAGRRHAFIMVGSKTLFLVHMTMFHMEEHCYQIVLRAQLPAAEMGKFRQWRQQNPTQTYFLANLTESALDIPQIASGELTSFMAEVFAGIPPKEIYTDWPWSDQPPVIAAVRVTVERVVYYRHFDFNFDYPKNLTYVLFGAGDEAHMQSYQTKEPDYDHVLSMAEAPAWLPQDKLASAVTVNFPTCWGMSRRVCRCSTTSRSSKPSKPKLTTRHWRCAWLRPRAPNCSRPRCSPRCAARTLRQRSHGWRRTSDWWRP